MGKINEAFKTFNTTVRTVIGAGFVGLLSYGGYYGYSEYSKHQRELAAAQAQVEQLEVELKQSIEKLERLETSLKLLKTDQRLARLDVLKIERNEKDEAVKSFVRFVELSPKGDPISEGKTFELPGDVVYIDNWVIRFDDKFVENADLQRGTSLCLFRRIFSEQLRPSEGFPLDQVGMRPQAYARGGTMTEFEKELWANFWQFANDPDKASKMGIRAANGEAVSMKLLEGKSYNVNLRSSDGLSMKIVEEK